MPNSPIEWEGQEIYSGAAEDDQPHFPNHPQIGFELAGVSWSWFLAGTLRAQPPIQSRLILQYHRPLLIAHPVRNSR